MENQSDLHADGNTQFGERKLVCIGNIVDARRAQKLTFITVLDVLRQLSRLSTIIYPISLSEFVV